MTGAATKHTFVVYVEDKPGVLNRIASLFRRRSFNIDSLNVGTTHERGVSRMTIVCDADAAKARRIEANLYKLVNVLRVHDITKKESIDLALALIKVSAPATQRDAISKVVAQFNARLIDSAKDTLVVEITDNQAKVDALLAALKPFGVLEMVQTGTVSMTRGTEQQEWAHPTAPPSLHQAT